MGKFGKDAVRIRARLSALGEAEEAQSSTGGLLRRCVGAMTRSDKGNRRRLLCRYTFDSESKPSPIAALAHLSKQA